MKLKILNKILSIIMLILILFSIIQPVLAASGSGQWTGGQYDTGMKTTDNPNKGILARRLNNAQTGEKKSVFCAEHGTSFNTGTAYNGVYYTPTDPTIKRACQVAYLGWYKNYPWYTIDGGILASDMIWVKWDYVFTQQYIWEILGQSSATFIKEDEQNAYIAFKNKINDEIAQIKKRPSFDGTTISIKAGDSKILDDSNNVLSSYPNLDQTTNGIRIQHSSGSNSMTISVDANTNLENYTITDSEFKSWGMIKDGTQDNDTMVYFEFPSGIQNQFYCLNYNDPITLALALNIESFGRLELSKLDKNGNLLDGAIYNVKGPNGFNQNVSVENGKIVLENLVKGTYTIKEVTAPNGYLLDTKSYNVEVKVNETAYQAITNIEPTGNFTLVKKNASKTENLQGAKYRIWNENGYNKEFTTNSEGKIEVNGLELGKYNYQETQAPNGYLLDTQVYSFELKYKDQNTNVVYENVEKTDNEPTGRIILYKKSENGDKLAGATFSITANEDIYNKARTKKFYNKGQEVTKITTAENTGIAMIEGLPLGKYSVKEVQAPNGYLLNNKVHTVNLEYKNQNTPVIEISIEGIVNTEPTGKILVYKINENGDKLAGATFSITANEDIYNKARTKKFYNKGQEVAKITTAENTGIAMIEGLPLGKYSVKEVQAPYGYLLDNKIYDARIEYKNQNVDTVEIKFEGIKNSEPTGSIQIIKKSEQGDLIKDTVFKITANEDIKNVAGTITHYNKGQEVAKIITDNSGIAKITDIPLGKYVIEEVQATTGYLLDSTKEIVTLAYKGQNEKIILESIEKTNKEPYGEIKVYKTNDINSRVKGAEIALYAKEDIKNVAGTKTWYKKGDLISKQITNDRGTVTFSNLHLGHYYVKETNAPEGYLLNKKEFDANLKYKDQNTKTIYLDINSIIDDEPRGTISIIKKDSKTGSIPQGDATLEDAVYKVFANEDIYNKARTKKFYSNGDLVATRTMNEKGTTEDVTDLPLGKYIIKEEIASQGYLLDTKEYEANLTYKNQNEPIVSETVTSLEKVKEMGLHIFKSGIKVNSGVTPGLDGVEFTIKLNSAVERAYEQGYTYAEVWNGIDEDGNKVTVNSKRVAEAQVIAPTYEVIRTDSEGNAYTQKKLPYGKFIVKETKTSTDYETAVDFTFTISDDETEIKDIPKKTKHIVVNNEQIEAYIKLIKKDLKSDKNVTLNSTTFEIKATKDIYDRATKKILFKKGESISQKVGNTTCTSFTTNADNIVVPDNSYNSNNDNKAEVTTPLKLPVGSYQVNEIKVPDGFLKLDKPITFEIKNIKNYDQDKDGDYIKEIVIKNEQPTGTIKLDKTIAIRENVDTSLVDLSNLSKIEFKLLAKENIIDKADGSIIYKKGQEINKYNLTKDGKLTIDKLPMGVYEIEETKTLDGLALNRKKYEVKFEQKDLVTKVYDKKLDVTNDTTLVDISKTNVTGENELPGAKLTILDSDNKIIDTWISTDKAHKIEGLLVGKEYTLKEEIAPNGYVKATSIKFKINDTNEIQKVNMKDKVVSMSKTDIGGNEVEGAKIQIIDKNGKIIDEWTSTKEEHKIKNLIENETYTLHEETAPNGFVKATDITFKVTNEKKDQHIKLIDKVVEILKEDISGKEIEGAKLQVVDVYGNLIDEWVSTKDSHKVKGLEEGKTYRLYEELAVGNYVKASEIEFEVTTDKETQKVVMIDKLVEVTKTDLTSGEELEGAELVITDEEGNIIDAWTSSKEPHQVKGLEEGKTYILKETTAPYGYEITEKIKFTVTTDKETQKVEMKDMPILKNIKVIKIDSETKESIKDKFTFAIYEDQECTKLIKEVQSNIEDGTALFEELRYGIYYIKETISPKDYELSTRIVKVEINDKGIFVDNEQVEEKENTIEFSFENKKIEVPKTGDESSIKFIGGILILSILGIAYIIIHNRDKNKDK